MRLDASAWGRVRFPLRSRGNLQEGVSERSCPYPCDRAGEPVPSEQSQPALASRSRGILPLFTRKMRVLLEPMKVGFVL